MTSKHLWLIFAAGLLVVVVCFGWFLQGIGEGGGEAPIAGVAAGILLILGAALTGIVKTIRIRAQQSSDPRNP